jgi:hypothetical protein
MPADHQPAAWEGVTVGYRPPSQKFKIEYAPGHDLHGLELTVKQGNMGIAMRVAKLSKLRSDKNMSPENIAMIDEAFDAFASILVSWNVEDDDGNPVPATKDGLYSLDFEFLATVMTAWSEKVAGVSAPLPKPSDNGKTLAEGLIPMETLSPSLLS